MRTLGLLLFFCSSVAAQQPNVLLIITDDQGYGDLGFHGNHLIQTPTIDAMARESIRFTNFYVSPVCAPTRSSLMTGRYSLRTGVRDTYNGGAIMAPGEITIAEMLKEAGYSTGMFGKWHLGDNYPSRPMDQGFDESVMHLSGGMGQVGDFTTYFQKERSYFDPILWKNGEQKSYDGYCSDIFTSEAIEFIRGSKEPFFCYLSFNAPHTPLQLPEKYEKMYAATDPTQLPGESMTERDIEAARKVYGMVSNIDDNLARLFATLDEMGIKDNTIIIFMTDNGPQQRRYVGGLRGRKGSVYEGGIKVPFFLRYPQLGKDKDIPEISVHMDVLPTLATLCSATLPDVVIDGRDASPLMTGGHVEKKDRSLFFYWSRKYPELYQNMAIIKGRKKLVGHDSYNSPVDSLELFDLTLDPGEKFNILADNRNVALGLQKEMLLIYEELITSANLKNPPAIHIGREENPVYLNRNDAGGVRGIWAQNDIYGQWKTNISKGTYRVTFKFLESVEPGKIFMEIDQRVIQQKIKKGGDLVVINNLDLPESSGVVTPFYQSGGKRSFPFWVKFERIE